MFGDAGKTTALLNRLTHRCYIIEAGNDPHKFVVTQGEKPQ